MGDVPPFHLSTVIHNLYNTPDLLDLSASGTSTPPSRGSSPQPTGPSLFASATSIAAAAGRRAAARASSATSSPGSLVIPDGVSPPRQDVRIEVRCVEGFDDNIYIGRSDGVIEWWTCDAAAGTSKHQGWALKRQHTLFPRRAISRIILLPKVQRLFMLSEGTLHPLALPNLDTLPSTVIQPLRGIVSVVLNDEELEWGGPGSESRTAEMTMVVVRRSGLGTYRVGQRLVPVKEIPLPSAPTALALTDNFLCAALPVSGNYALIDISDASLTEVLPISQTEISDDEVAPRPNIVVIPGESEFLVSSFTGTGSMGVFLNGQGDPVRGTLEWPDHPLSIAIESGFIIALLKNQTIAVHSLEDLDKPAQAILLDSSFSAFNLSYSPYGINVRDIERDQRLATGRLPLIHEKWAASVKGAKPDSRPGPEAVSSPGPVEDPPSGSGLTPPSSPRPLRVPTTPTRSASLVASNSRLPFSKSVAETLVIGPDGIDALSPTPALLRLEQLCQQRRLNEAIVIVEEERRRGRRGEIEGDKTVHQATLRYMYLYLACHLLFETSFEKAGDYFVKGKVDPRLLVRLFPKLRGKTIGSAEEVEIYEGLRSVLAETPAIDQILDASISRNYSPHVSPNTAEAPATTELRRALEADAKAMLTDVLRKTRQSRRKGGGARGIDSRKIDIVIDTTLAKLLAETGVTNELLALLAGPNDIVLAELEPFLQKRPYVLATVMRQQGRVDRVLEILQSIAEGESDPLCEDPVDEIAQQLDGVQDPDIFIRYTKWLVTKSPERALALLCAPNPGDTRLDDAALVDELRSIDQETADKYLEHAVVVKKSPLRQLHEALLQQLLEQASREIEDEGVRYHLEELDVEYRQSFEPRPYTVFLADFAPMTPIKILRLKLILFLQGSPFYDLASAAAKIETMPGLSTEMAIILGRQGRNKRALRLLAREIGDFVSAQAYCTQGGEIVPPKVAHLVAAHVPELAAWATLGDVGRKRRGTVDAKVQEALVMDLLGVYMQDGASTARQGAALLNAQAVHLDILDILKRIPDDWPLDVVSTFFQRGLRRELHESASWQILKAISAGQNLETSEAYLEHMLEMRPVIAAGPSPMSLPDEGSIAEKEYGPTSSFDVKEFNYAAVRSDMEAKGKGFFSPDIINKELREIHDAESGELR